jgi:hypothetical protein
MTPQNRTRENGTANYQPVRRCTHAPAAASPREAQMGSAPVKVAGYV